MNQHFENIITEIDVASPPKRKIAIGHQGEHKFRKVVFNVSRWHEHFPSGTTTVVIKRPDGETYPVVLNAAGDKVEYSPSRTDTDVVGDGWIEIRMTSGNTVGKSCKMAILIESSLSEPGSPPEDVEVDWLGRIIEATQDTAVQAQQYAAEAASSASAAQSSADEAAESAELISEVRDAIRDGVVVTVESTTNAAGVHGITVVYDNGTERFIEVGTNGMAFDGGYVDKIDEYGDESDNYYLHLTQEGEDVNGFTPFIIPATGDSGGGSAGGTTMRLTSRMVSKNFSVISTAKTCNILYTWSSVESGTGESTGEGTETWYVNGARAMVIEEVGQGNRSFDVFQERIRNRLTDGASNAIKLVIADSSGSTRTYTWNVTVAVYSLTWNAPEISNHGTSKYSIQLVPNGTGNKYLYVKVDDTFVKDGELVTSSGRSITVDIPAQEHGAHTVLAWIEADVDGEKISTESDALRHIGIWYKSGNTNKIVAVFESEFEINQYASHDIKYMVYDPTTEHPTIERMITNRNVSPPTSTSMPSITVDRTLQTWAWRGNNSGNYALTIMCGTGSDAASASVSASVISSGNKDIAPVTEGQIMLLDPTGHSNGESHPEQFGYIDDTGANHPLTLSSNFDWVHGGFHSDENGNTAFVVHRGTTAAFDTSLFTDTLRDNGKHIEIIFKTANVRNYEAKIIESYADINSSGKGIGMRLFANSAELSCQSQAIDVDYCEEELVEMSFDIEKNDSNSNCRMKIWIDGMPSAAAIYDTNAANWKQTDTSTGKLVIGSADADVWVYRIRVYNNNLQNGDILANYIADAPTAEDVLGRYERNQIYTDTGAISINDLRRVSPNLHIIQITASNFPTGKDTQVACKIEHWLGEDESHHFIAENAGFVLQGTSSLNYIASAGNIDIDLRERNDDDKHPFDTVVKDGNGDVIENYEGYAMRSATSSDPGSMPERYFCLKVNTASSENANNACSTDWFNQFYPTESLAHKRDRRVRNTIEAHPCIILFTNDNDSAIRLGSDAARSVASGETILYAAGDMCNSKKTFDVFGQTESVGTDSDGVPVFCVEFMDNSYNRCLYLDSDFSNETWKNSSSNSNGQFEFRYPKKGKITDAMKNKFIAMQNWVCGTNTAKASGNALPESVTLYNPLTGVNETFTKDTALYRGCRFRAELADWFDVNGLIFYYVFTNFFLSVDQRAKNTFVSYEPDKNGVWKFNYSKYYDGDTILGINNKGDLTLRYGLEDTDTILESGVSGNVFNASTSVLWSNIRDYCADWCAEMYNTKETEGCWSAANIQKKWNDHQRIRPESIMIDDSYNKYDRPWVENTGDYRTKMYLESMMNGEKRSQRMHFLKYQEAYMSSKYLSNNAKNHSILLNIYSPQNAVIPTGTYFTITPYCDLYVSAKFGNIGTASVRAKKGVATLVALRDSSGKIISDMDEVTDKETSIYLAPYVSDISTMAHVYTQQCDLSGAKKLRRLALGSTELGYENTNLTTLSVEGAPLLEEINICGLTRLRTSLDLSACIFLEKFYATSSGLTGITFADGSGVDTVYLPSVSVLNAINLKNLQTFVMDDSNITRIRVEGSPMINTQSIVQNSPNIAVGRMLGIDWSFQNADAVKRLIDKRGLDSSGQESYDYMILGGDINFAVATNDELALLTEKLCKGEYTLNITADTIVEPYEVTFYDEDGTTILKDANGQNYKQIVRSGEAPHDPVSAGDIPTPTKQGTALIGYVFSTWINMSTDEEGLGPVSGNTQYKAKYTEYTPKYTVTFWGQAGYAGSYLQRTTNVEPEAFVYYTGADLPDVGDTKWMGWDKNTDCVTSDLDVFPVYMSTIDKSQIPVPTNWDTYEYLYSDDYSDYDVDPETGTPKAAYTLQQFWSILSSDDPTTHLQIAKKVKMLLGYRPKTNISDTRIEFVLAGYNRFRESVADRTVETGSLAKAFFLMVDCLNATRAMNGSNSNAGGWPAMSLRAWLNNSLYKDLPVQWRQMIKKVDVLSTAGNQSSDIVYSEDYLFLPSYTEVGFGTGSPYINEIDFDVYNGNLSAATLPIFTNAASRIKHIGFGGTEATTWWLRSPHTNREKSCLVDGTGRYPGTLPKCADRHGVAFGFCI